MTKTIGAIYDGKTFCPDEPLDLKPDTHVTLTIQIQTDKRGPHTNGDSIEKFFGSIDLGYPTGLDNEEIDADLAREYGSNHEDED